MFHFSSEGLVITAHSPPLDCGGSPQIPRGPSGDFSRKGSSSAAGLRAQGHPDQPWLDGLVVAATLQSPRGTRCCA